MKLINISLDDLNLLSQDMRAVSITGEPTILKVLTLGEPLAVGLSSKIAFGAKTGWNISDEDALLTDRFCLRSGFRGPVVWDMGRKVRGNNLLFTGIYSLDVSRIETMPVIRCVNYRQLRSTKVIAGGLKRTRDGKEGLNLVLSVPSEAQFVVGESYFSVRTGTKVLRSVSGFDYDLNTVLAQCEHYY